MVESEGKVFIIVEHEGFTCHAEESKP